jgi:hypothetical protein
MSRRRWNIETIKKVVDGENPFFQIGFDNPLEIRKEGEIWEDSKGVRWQKENGVKKRLSKTDTPILDEINKIYICKKCKCDTRFSDNAHKKMDERVIFKTGLCFDCLQEEEMAYRVNGKWGEYEKMKLLRNKRSILDDFKLKVMESIDFLKKDSGVMGIMTEDGEMMTWTGKSELQSKWLKDAEEDLVRVNEELEKMDKEITTLESELEKSKICQTNQT